LEEQQKAKSAAMARQRLKAEEHAANEDLPTKKGRSRRAIGKKSLWAIRLTLFACFATTGLYYLATVRPEAFWLAGFSGFLIPVFQLILAGFLLFWITKRPFFSVFPLFTLLLGIRFIQASWGWHFLITEPCKDFKVVSFNAKTFGGMDPDKKGDKEICTGMLKKMLETQADIFCIQEMFDNPKSKKLNVIERLKKAGYKHIYFSKAGTMRWGTSVGMAICSRYPILSRKAIRKKKESNNQIISALIDINGQSVVVVNMHLQSIFIKEDELDPNRIKENFKASFFNIASKMRKAYQARTSQIDQLLARTLDEELPLIIAGDMNDTPYSNAYLRLRDSYKNGFEEKGSGFGFTYNGPLPFLRIDHQFANDRLEFTRFRVNDEFEGSDHFGTEACYRIRK
jgi:endonuclease/exonuclease/phosphatase family metal-dependent hydrolase